MQADEFPPTDSPRSDWLGLGVDYGIVRLTPARAEWAAIADRLAAAILAALGERAVAVEHVGSTAVAGLATKPIIDLAVGVRTGTATDEVRELLERLGYEFRGDAGESGGLVFVLSDRPQHRVAHLHVVEHGGSQWHRYLAFRDVLVEHASARAVYERRKSDLAGRFPNDRKSYQAGKDDVVHGLLERHARGRLPERIEGDGIVLRRWRETDAGSLGRAVSESEAHLRPWMAFMAHEPQTTEQRAAMLRAREREWLEGGDVMLGVFIDGVVAGSCGLHRRLGPSALELGYWIHRAYVRRGLATKVARLLTDAAFSMPEIEQVEIHSDKANVASAGVSNALGFQLIQEVPDEPTAPAEVGIECVWRMNRDQWAECRGA